jgi:hypothetical protein
VHRARKSDNQQSCGERGGTRIKQNEPETSCRERNGKHADARPVEVQNCGDERDATEELHLVKFDQQLPYPAGNAPRIRRAGGNERRCFDNGKPQIEGERDRRAPEQDQEICLARRRHEIAHGECCHAWRGPGNVVKR